MGKTTRRKFPPEFKAKVALEALKESSTKGDFAKQYEISPEMISRWKKELVENASAAFGAKSDTADFDKERDALHRKIGELEMDVDFCKRVYKQLGIPIPERHRYIQRERLPARTGSVTGIRAEPARANCLG